ncbi:hypothetical protein C0J52_10139, partial [Blattella germanica]
IGTLLLFPQSDIVHQSVYELVHSEDREELQRQLMWNSFLPPESANIVLQDVLQPENCHLLERSFTVRFRCLLDNTSGFLKSSLNGGGLKCISKGLFAFYNFDRYSLLTTTDETIKVENSQVHYFPFIIINVCALSTERLTKNYKILWFDGGEEVLKKKRRLQESHRLDIRGRIKVLHGQNRKTEEPPLALFAICTPFGPPSLLEIPQKEVMFKSKHKLDLTLVSMDQRGKMLLGYSDAELANLGGYDLVHYDDLAYVASAHQELLKTGASGMIAYRYQTKEGQWQWLQTSSRLVYKNSKPDFVISTHRPLMEEEGRDLLGKRTMDFKVSYLDAGLTNSYFTDSDQLVVGSVQHHSSPTSSHHGSTVSSAPQRVNRRYKTQLRDFLSTCRTKRKLTHHVGSTTPTGTANPAGTALPNTMAAVDYITATDSTSAAAAAVAAAYSNLNNMYTTPYPSTAVAASPADNGLTTYMGHTGNFHQTLYPAAAALDNRFLTTTDNLFHQYRPLGVGTYYPDYHHAAATTPYVSNGFLDMSPRATTCSLPTYDSSPTATGSHHHMHQLTGKTGEPDKLYSCQQLVDTTPNSKYATVVDSSRGYVVATNIGNSGKCLDVTSPYSVSPAAITPTGAVTIQPIVMTSSSPSVIGDMNAHNKIVVTGGKTSSKHSPSMDGMSSSNSAGSSPAATTANGLITPKLEDIKTEVSLLQSGSPPAHHQLTHHMAQQQVVQAAPPATAILPHHYSPPAPATDTPRQTVLMWGSGSTTTLNHAASSGSSSRSPPPNAIVNSNPGTPVVTTMSNGTPTTYGVHPQQQPDASPVNKKYNSNGDPLKSLAEMNSMSGGGGDACKWSGGGVTKPEPVSSASPTHPASSPALSAKSSYHHHHQHHQVVASHHPHHHHHQHHQHSGGLAYSETGAGSEVWPVHHQYHQYYPYTTPYHHHAPHTPVSDNGYPQISRTGVLCCPSLR